jgi:hypothetical protein
MNVLILDIKFDTYREDALAQKVPFMRDHSGKHPRTQITPLPVGSISLVFM